MSTHHLAAQHREWTSIRTVQVRRRFGTALPRAANWDRPVDLRQSISIRESGGRVALSPQALFLAGLQNVALLHEQKPKSLVKVGCGCAS